MPLEEVGGLQPGARVRTRPTGSQARVGEELLGRVLDGFGRPLDGKGALGCAELRPLFSDPAGPMEREPIRQALATGVRSIDAVIPCGKGQRVGIFGGSGVGKSTLLAAMARNGSADVNVIAMIGERNREVRAFLEETLEADGLARSVVIAATSDRPAPVRVRAAFLAATVADWFREQGRDVLLIMDSATRLAMAQREIGLAAGEPPSQKGYTPSVFQLLPRLFERAGNFAKGSVTGFYTVLVEGDDLNEPIADAVRALLDGHIVLSRELAHRNHYPAIDVLQSVSRLQRAIAGEAQLGLAGRLREALAEYRQSEDLVRLGAYAAGSNPKLDAAIKSQDDVLAFLRQDLREAQPIEKTLAELEAATCGLK
jgi:FliI/YscN family ATPase